MESGADRGISSFLTGDSDSKTLKIQIPADLAEELEESNLLPTETRDEHQASVNQQGQGLDMLNEDQTENSASVLDESGAAPENSRRHRRSSMVSYKEPSVRAKLRAGDQFTFSSGYEAGIKILSMAERDRDRAKRRSRQSLS